MRMTASDHCCRSHADHDSNMFFDLELFFASICVSVSGCCCCGCWLAQFQQTTSVFQPARDFSLRCFRKRHRNHLVRTSQDLCRTLASMVLVGCFPYHWQEAKTRCVLQLFSSDYHHLPSLPWVRHHDPMYFNLNSLPFFSHTHLWRKPCYTPSKELCKYGRHKSWDPICFCPKQQNKSNHHLLRYLEFLSTQEHTGDFRSWDPCIF